MVYNKVRANSIFHRVHHATIQKVEGYARQRLIGSNSTYGKTVSYSDVRAGGGTAAGFSFGAAGSSSVGAVSGVST